MVDCVCCWLLLGGVVEVSCIVCWLVMTGDCGVYSWCSICFVGLVLCYLCWFVGFSAVG